MFEYCRDWAGKFPGAGARMAALSHVARHIFNGPESREIGLEDMEAALAHGGCPERHAPTVFDLMGAETRR